MLTLYHKVMHKIFPPRCVFCQMKGHQGKDLCAGCEGDLPWIRHPCGGCGRDMGQTFLPRISSFCTTPENIQVDDAQRFTQDIIWCGDCLKFKPPYDHAVSCFRYIRPIDQSIAAFKFYSTFTYRKMFAEHLLERIKADYSLDLCSPALHKKGSLDPGFRWGKLCEGSPERFLVPLGMTGFLPRSASLCISSDRQLSPLPEVIIPVPLHLSRLRKRGFNQALELAKPLEKALGIPIDIKSCRRIRATQPQPSMPADHRASNVRGAFKVRLARLYHHVAIIDDVVTTGATVRELARCLKKEGVRRVDVWSVAKV